MKPIINDYLADTIEWPLDTIEWPLDTIEWPLDSISVISQQMNPILFTTVRPEQAEQVTVLAEEIWPAVYSDMISAEQIQYMLGWMYNPEKIRSEIEELGIVYLWIVFEGVTAGFTGFGPVKANEVCFIHKIYVAPDFHRRGIGKATLSHIESFAAEKGAVALELRVNRTNQRALGLYRSAGFEILSEDCAIIGGGFVMDDYILGKEIK